MPTVAARVARAAAMNISAQECLAAAADASPSVRRALAQNPAAPTEALRTLVDDKDWALRWDVILHPNADAALHQYVYARGDIDSRRALAQAPQLSTDLVHRLVHDPSRAVRIAMAESTADVEVLTVLARDPDHQVRAVVAIADRLTPELVEQLFHDRRAEVRSALACNRPFSRRLRRRMANDRSVQVRWALAWTFPDDLALMRLLENDTHPDVASQAHHALTSPLPGHRRIDPLDD